jgi:hypothetical protein
LLINKNQVLKKYMVVLLLVCCTAAAAAQQTDTLYSFLIGKDVTVTIDRTTGSFKSKKPVLLILYALPNGNTTAQTLGKKLVDGDDWHFDIQHIRAQTNFLRKALPNKNIVVALLENEFKSWPAWKQKHPKFTTEIKFMVDTLSALFHHPAVCLNGHSGGGSFIFGYLKAADKIPAVIQRISFLDSDYGYDSTYTSLLRQWLMDKRHALNVFAYNDSVALYNGKPVVSATGGTWYRSHLLLNDLSSDFKFAIAEQNDSLVIIKSINKRIQFFFKLNPERKIFHTQQVELNGFIHSVLCGTKMDSKGYRYYGERAYTKYIQ